MGEITRRWPFEGDDHEPFDLIVREPPLTGDNLGLKTWGSSYVLAQMLSSIGKTSLSHLLSPADGQPKPSVLELGSGTGLLGLAAAALWQTHVILSDLPEIMANLSHNVETNRAMIAARGGSLEAGALTWGDHDEVDPVIFQAKNSFKVIVVADPLYDDDHPSLLAGAIDEQLVVGKEARVMVMVPQRDATTVKLLAAFRDEMASKRNPLFCLEETLVQGEDDWGGDDDDEGAHVKCWLGIFGRRSENA